MNIPPIKLIHAAKYYKELPHQINAFNFLEQHLLKTNGDEVLETFANIYRNPLVIEEKSNIINPHQKILLRLKELKIQPDLLPNKYINNENYRLTIVGIEGINLNFTKNNDVLDKYNDIVLGLLNYGNDNIKFTRPFLCTMEPGRYYTINRLNSLGAAKIVLDMKHSDIWQIGRHKNQKNCLIQIGAPITVHRDKNSDGFRNDNIIKKGWYGINLHHNGSNSSQTPSSIGRWSAGCTVIHNINNHQNFMNNIVRKDFLCKQSLNTKFSYIPLDGSKIF